MSHSIRMMQFHKTRTTFISGPDRQRHVSNCRQGNTHFNLYWAMPNTFPSTLLWYRRRLPSTSNKMRALVLSNGQIGKLPALTRRTYVAESAKAAHHTESSIRKPGKPPARPPMTLGNMRELGC